MANKQVFIIVTAMILAGCKSMYVKPQIENERQFVVKHGSGWIKQAQESAEAHCASYNKKIMMRSTDCSDPGLLRCMTIYDCVE